MLKFKVLFILICICFTVLFKNSSKKKRLIFSQDFNLDQEPHCININFKDYVHNLSQDSRTGFSDKKSKVSFKKKPLYLSSLWKHIIIYGEEQFREFSNFFSTYIDFINLINTNIYKNYQMTMTINEEKSGNSDLFLFLITPKTDLPLDLFQQILLFYVHSNATIQEIFLKLVQWIYEKFAASIVDEDDEIINKGREKINENSEVMPKNTDFTINIHTKECGEMKAHSGRLGEKKYDLQIYLPVLIGNNSKENIISSETLLRYQLLIRELLMCKFVFINPAIPMSLLVAYLILSTITINEAKGKKLRKFFILKYSYKEAADQLLWISHDVEKNPGPVRQTFSEKLRPVTQKLGAKLLKIFEGKQTKKSPNNLWTTEAGFYLYDHSTEKVYSCTYKSIEIEALIDILVACCKEQECDISELCEEITAWELCDFNKLFHLYSISTAIEKVNVITSNLARILQYAKRVAIDEKMVELGIQLNYTSFQIWLSINFTEEERKKADLSWEACRYITSALCKHVNKESKRGKYSIPPDWSAEREKFQNPYNEKSGHDIKIFFKDLLDYCSKREKGNWIPQEFKSYIKACEAWIKDPKQQKDLLQEYVLHHDFTVIKEYLRLLQTDCSLCNVTSMLEERGIYLKSDNCSILSLQSDPTSTSKKRKYKVSETSEKLENVKMTRNNDEISELETAQEYRAILKVKDAKVSPKERKLRTEMEIWIKITLNGEPIKVITHGYKPDFSKFKEVQCQDAQKKQKPESLEESKYEYQSENGRLIENIGDEREEFTNNNKLNARDITKENNDCDYTMQNFDICEESENFCGTKQEIEDFIEISTIKPNNETDESVPKLLSGTSQNVYVQVSRSPEMTDDILSPDAYIHQSETEENSSNTASNDNNMNTEYHDDKMFEDIPLNNSNITNDYYQSLMPFSDDVNIMNWD